MRTFALSLLPVLIAATVPDTAAATTRLERIHPERDELPPNFRYDQVFADLKAVLTGPATAATIATGPYPSSRNGLCQRDVISLKYERVRDTLPRSPREHPASIGPFEPVGIQSVDHEYHYLGYDKTETRDGWRQACQALADKDVYWVKSESDTSAEFALVTLNRAVTDTQENKDVTIDCGSLGFEDEAKCTSAFLAAASQPTAAGRCNPTAGGDCYAFETAKLWITISIIYSPGRRLTEIKLEDAPIILT